MVDDTIRQFQSAVWDYYHEFGRHDLPWRQPEASGRFDPYKIMVSELMLQQTQVQRVIPKYHAFLAAFPTLSSLAEAELGNVLRAWAGLGYNRRAKFLHQAAQRIIHDHAGIFPSDSSALVLLPGIGVNTAGAVVAYAFNRPVIFIETNVRTAIIHHFFPSQEVVSDKEIHELVRQTLDTEHPREWYWALMDYGSYLKRAVANHAQRGAGYAKQSAFQGSRRQVRGAVLRALAGASRTQAELAELIGDERLPGVLQDLSQESLIRQRGAYYSL